MSFERIDLRTDMAGILIIAHAPFASALRDCLAHIYGGLPARIAVIDVLPDSDPVLLLQEAREQAEKLQENNGTLVLTDLLGATPANIAARLAPMPGIRVLAGVNLPMLVRAVCYRGTPLDTLVDKALAGASKGIQCMERAGLDALASAVAAGLGSPCCGEEGGSIIESASPAPATDVPRGSISESVRPLSNKKNEARVSRSNDNNYSEELPRASGTPLHHARTRN